MSAQHAVVYTLFPLHACMLAWGKIPYQQMNQWVLMSARIDIIVAACLYRDSILVLDITRVWLEYCQGLDEASSFLSCSYVTMWWFISEVMNVSVLSCVLYHTLKSTMKYPKHSGCVCVQPVRVVAQYDKIAWHGFPLFVLSLNVCASSCKPVL